MVGNEPVDNLQAAFPAISLLDLFAIKSAYANDCKPLCASQLQVM
jgi:hypothetical protein